MTFGPVAVKRISDSIQNPGRTCEHTARPEDVPGGSRADNARVWGRRERLRKASPLAHFLLGVLVALSAPVTAHKAHTTPRCPDQPNPRSGRRAITKYIRCVARIVPRFNAQKAIAVASCESGLRPDADENPPYAGVYQHDTGLWKRRATAYGFRGHSAYDPVANIWVTARMVQYRGWGAWPECGAA